MDETYAAQYPSLWRDHWWWRARQRLVLHRLTELAAQRSSTARTWRILDVGCAGGVAFDDWSRFGDVWGIEPDEELAGSTPEWTHRVTCAPLEAYEPPAEEFDVVILLDVLEHIDDDRAALRRLAALLAPTGALLATVPAAPILWSVHDEVNEHHRRYRKRELREGLLGAGLEPQRLEHFFGWSFPLLLARRFVAARGRPYRVTVPPAPVNRLFEALCRAEQWLGRVAGFAPPIGSSLLAIARRVE